jgi:hypothetical protein
MSKFPEKRIEEIESGFETWFSSVDRQRLAKALGVEPYILKEVETRTSLTDELKEQLQMRELNDKILAGENGLSCPHCNHTLNTSVQNGLDIEGLPIQFAKAFCTKCPFVLK